MADTNNESVVKITADTSEAEQKLDKLGEQIQEDAREAEHLSSTLGKMAETLNEADASTLDSVGKEVEQSLNKALASLTDMMGDVDELGNKICTAWEGSTEEVDKLISKCQNLKSEVSEVAENLNNMSASELEAAMSNIQSGFKGIALEANNLGANSVGEMTDELENAVDMGAVPLKESLSAAGKTIDEATSNTQNLSSAGEEASKSFESVIETVKSIGDAYNFSEPFKEAEQAASNMGQDMSSMGNPFEQSTHSAIDFSNALERNAASYEHLKAERDAMASGMVATQGYEEEKQAYNDATAALDKYLKMRQDATKGKQAFTADEWNNIIQGEQEAINQAEEYSNKMAQMRTNGTAFTPQLTNNEEINESIRLIQQYRNEQSKMESGSVERDEMRYRELDEEITRLIANVRQLKNDMNIQPRIDITGLQQMDQQLSNLSQKNARLGQTTQQISQGTNAMAASTSASFSQMNSSIDATTSNMQGAATTITSCLAQIGNMCQVPGMSLITSFGQAASGSTSLIQDFGNVISGVFEIAQYEGNISADVVSKAWGKVSSVAKSVASSIMQIVSQKIQQGVKKLANSIRKLSLELVGLGEHTNVVKRAFDKVIEVFQRWWTMMTRYVMRAAIRAIFGDIEDDIGIMAQSCEEFNTKLSSLIDSCKALGLQFVAAFEPLMSMVMPTLINIVDWLTAAMEKLSQFMAVVAGRDYYYKAVKGNSDYAASMDDTTESTQNAQKATESFQSSLAGFDQLNRLSGSSGSSLGNIGEAVEATAESIGIDSPTLEKVDVGASKLTDIAGRIRDALNSDDWYSMGYSLGEAVLNAFDWLDETFGWEKNAEKVRKWCQKLIDGFNGFVDFFLEVDEATGMTHAQELGHDIADLLNTPIMAFNMLFDPETGFNLEGFGDAIGQALVQACADLNWYELGQDIAYYMQIIPRTLNGVFKNDVGKALGEGFSEGVRGFADSMSVDTWSQCLTGMINNLFDFINEALSDTDAFAEIGQKVATIITNVFTNLTKADPETGESRLETAIKSIFDAIDALLNGTNGSNGFIANLKIDAKSVETFVHNVTSAIFEGLESIFDPTNSGKNQDSLATKIGSFIEGAVAGVKDTIDDGTIKKLADKIMTSILNGLSEAFSVPQNFWDIAVGIGEAINAMIYDLQDDLNSNESGIKNAIKSIVGMIAGFFTTVDWSALSDAIVEMLEEAKQDMLVSNLITGVKGFLSFIEAVFSEALSLVPAGDITAWLVQMFRDIVFTGLKGLGEYSIWSIQKIFMPNREQEAVEVTNEAFGTDFTNAMEAWEYTNQIQLDAIKTDKEALTDLRETAETELGLTGQEWRNLANNISGDADDIELAVDYMKHNSVDDMVEVIQYANSLGDTSTATEAIIRDTTIQMNNDFNVLGEVDTQVGHTTEEISALAEESKKLNSLSDGIKGVTQQTTDISKAAEAMNDLAQAMNKMPKGTGTHELFTFNYSAPSTFSIPALASGGSVGDGQLFLANEQGVEMITADPTGGATVTNNDQMVSAIKQGVQEAITNAINNNNQSNNEDIVLMIDSEELARATMRGQRSINRRTNPTVAYNYV